MAISKCFRGSLRLRDNESRLLCDPLSEPSHQNGSDYGSEYMFYAKLTKTIRNYHKYSLFSSAVCITVMFIDSLSYMYISDVHVKIVVECFVISYLSNSNAL